MHVRTECDASGVIIPLGVVLTQLRGIYVATKTVWCVRGPFALTVSFIDMKQLDKSNAAR